MATLIAGSTVLAAPPTGARGRWGAGPGWQGRGNRSSQPGMLAAMTHRLNLTDEQTEKIQDITQQARTEGRETGRALAEAREALNDVVADGAEEEQIRGAADALAKAIANQAIHQSRTRASIREVLTEEQREQLAERKERFGRFPGRPMDRGSRPRSQRGRGGRGAGWGRPASRMGRPGRALQSEIGPRGPRGMRGPQGRSPMSAERGPGRGAFSDSRGMNDRFREPMQGPPMGQTGRRGWAGRGRQAEQAPRMGQRRRGPALDEQSHVGQGGPMGRRDPQGRGPVFLDRMFEGADANDDGMLSKDEVKAFRDEMPTRPAPRRQR